MLAGNKIGRLGWGTNTEECKGQWGLRDAKARGKAGR